jgi:hypothetical protein
MLSLLVVLTGCGAAGEGVAEMPRVRPGQGERAGRPDRDGRERPGEGGQASSGWELRTLGDPLAVCNDGGQMTYFVRKGSREGNW